MRQIHMNECAITSKASSPPFSVQLLQFTYFVFLLRSDTTPYIVEANVKYFQISIFLEHIGDFKTTLAQYFVIMEKEAF